MTCAPCIAFVFKKWTVDDKATPTLNAETTNMNIYYVSKPIIHAHVAVTGRKRTLA